MMAKALAKPHRRECAWFRDLSDTFMSSRKLPMVPPGWRSEVLHNGAPEVSDSAITFIKRRIGLRYIDREHQRREMVWPQHGSD